MVTYCCEVLYQLMMAEGERVNESLSYEVFLKPLQIAYNIDANQAL